MSEQRDRVRELADKLGTAAFPTLRNEDWCAATEVLERIIREELKPLLVAVDNAISFYDINGAPIAELRRKLMEWRPK